MLIVDDEVENLDAFTLNFGRKFLLRTASSGPEALEIAKGENIAVVIADQRMPGMSGTEFLGELKKIRKPLSELADWSPSEGLVDTIAGDLTVPNKTV